MRFLHLHGVIPMKLGGAVPPVGGWRFASVPPTMAVGDVQRLLDHTPRERTVRVRDYAILMLVARLGLRSIEVARLLLDEVDWRCGEIVVRGKGRREDRLPLPTDVGEALVTYLDGPRPHLKDRHLFLTCRGSARADPGGPGRRRRATGVSAGRLAHGRAAPAASCPGRRRTAARRRAHSYRAGAPAPRPGHDRALREGQLRRTARGRTALARDGGGVTDLCQALDDYLRLGRSLGHQMAEAAYPLPDFVTFMGHRGEQTVTVLAALEWMKSPEPEVITTVSPRRITAVRGFARYLSGTDPATEVPPLGLVPYNRRRGQVFLYSDADIAAIMASAKETIAQPLRAATYQTLIGLLAAAGLRIGEAVKLDRDDIDWNQGVLHIRESKFDKSRLVPLQDSTTNALREYDKVRERLMPRPQDPTFFVSLTGKRLIYACVHPVFKALVCTARVGLDAPHRPRLHELGHTFAVRTLLHWYRTEDNVQARIPSLSTYMGHREPAYTYWYLSAAPELLALAAARRNGVRKAARP